jgi:murein DD-endopeptidase MepM/ murein hydrolase activator NlpD
MQDVPFHFRQILLIVSSIIVLLIAGCASKPTKPTPLDQNIIRKLQQQSLPSRLPIPVQGIAPKQLKDTWGASRSAGRAHEGIDIMADKGTKVYSTTDGLVTSLKGNNLGGTVVWIRGPAGSWHYYAHLHQHKRGLSEGDYVRKGELIGYVGNTGNAKNTAPHLHYGIYLTGKGRGATNPYPYLR